MFTMDLLKTGNMNDKLNIGMESEDEAQRIIEGAFSSDFVFRSPDKVDGHEVADIIILFKDVALVVQVKSRSPSEDPVEGSRSLAWTKKNLSKAVRQVTGAVRAIQGGRMPTLENSRRGKINYPEETIKWIYGLVVIHHQAPPYRATDLCQDLQSAAIPIHVLSLVDFNKLCKRLDTPWDLIGYLEHRALVLLEEVDAHVHREGKVFNHYIENLESVWEKSAKRKGDEFARTNVEVYGRELRKIVKGEHSHQRAGFVIDHIINKAHTAEEELSGNSNGENMRESYARVAEALASIPRARRIALGRAYLRIAKESSESGEERFHLSHSPLRGDCMLLVASPLSRNQRAQRAEDLYAMTFLAKQYHQVERALGIATEPAGQMGSSYDMVFMDSPSFFDENFQSLGADIFGELGGSLLDE